MSPGVQVVMCVVSCALALPGSLALLHKPALPAAEEVLQNPHRIYKDVDKRISDLEARLAESQATHATAIRKQKSAFEAQLAAQANENQKQKQTNRQISREIDDLLFGNRETRAQAQQLQQTNGQLKTNLELMLSNISIAQEFAQAALDQTMARMDFQNNSDLTVLAELDAQEAEESKLRAHRQKLAAISAIQMSVDKEDVPQLLRAMSHALDELAVQHNSSLTLLEHKFDEAMQALQKEHADVMEEQAKLNTTRAQERLTKHKLDAALAHLTETKERLSARTDALRAFAQRLGASPLVQAKSKGMSLLQIAGETASEKPLPPISKLLEAPHEVIRNMNSHVDSLEQRLQEVQHAHMGTVLQQKQDYEQKLQDQADENKGLDQQNKVLTREIQELRSSSQDLRAQAKSFVKKNTDLRAHLNRLMANMSTAHEFTVNALSHAQSKLSNSSELQVLADLAAEETARNEDLAHSSRLNQIADANKIAMLEFGAKRYVRKGPALELLKQITATLNDLNQEQNQSLASLKASFDTMFAKGEALHEELSAKRAELNATKADEIKLHERLVAALDHLKKVYKQLDDQVQSLQGFLRKLGGDAVAKKEDSHETASSANGKSKERPAHKKGPRASKAKHHKVSVNREDELTNEEVKEGSNKSLSMAELVESDGKQAAAVVEEAGEVKPKMHRAGSRREAREVPKARAATFAEDSLAKVDKVAGPHEKHDASKTEAVESAEPREPTEHEETESAPSQEAEIVDEAHESEAKAVGRHEAREASKAEAAESAESVEHTEPTEHEETESAPSQAAEIVDEAVETEAESAGRHEAREASKTEVAASAEESQAKTHQAASHHEAHEIEKTEADESGEPAANEESESAPKKWWSWLTR